MSNSEVRFNLGPYSHIVIAIPDTYVHEDGLIYPLPAAQVLATATTVAEQLQEWWTEQLLAALPTQPDQQEPYVGPDGDPGPQDEHVNEAPHVRHAQQEAEQMRERAPRQENPRYGAGSGVETKEQMLARCWGTCPDCGHDSKPSIMKYQKWDTTDDGIEVPGKHYCSNESCPRKGGTIWRRELIPIPPF